MGPSLEDVQRALDLRKPARVDAAVASRAAVALILRRGARGLDLLFIRRADHPGDPWSGQVGFPGGRFEQTDADLSRTAVRETAEETGIDLDRHGVPLGGLDEIRAMARLRPMDLVITPFVFGITDRPAIAPSPEVRSVHWIALEDLLGMRFRSIFEYPHEGGEIQFPCFRLEGLVIWGLTYRMFSAFGDRLAEVMERPAPEGT